MIAHGELLGGAERLVSLDPDELVATACEATGLDDFGEAPWRESYDCLLESANRESRLHVVGRLMTRMEILQCLENRLRLAELWKRRPEMLGEAVRAPVFIVGSPRSGTSILHELMASDPATRAPAMWEMLFPVEAHGGTSMADLADRVVQFGHDLQPEYETMHANSGHLPNECIFITSHVFLSDLWGGSMNAFGYQRHLARADHRIAYRFHRRFLQTLQAGGGPRRWLLKAPSHLFQLRALFDVYPDARIVRTHRDPLKTLPSALNLMGTLKWMRCEEVDMGPPTKHLPAGFAALYQDEIAARASGELPNERFVDVHFDRLVRDPVGTVGDVYAALGWPFEAGAAEAVAEFARGKPKGARGEHRYSLEDVGLDAARERERFRFYGDHYGVQNEV